MQGLGKHLNNPDPITLKVVLSMLQVSFDDSIPCVVQAGHELTLLLLQAWKYRCLPPPDDECMHFQA